jgi:hypothetical protein
MSAASLVRDSRSYTALKIFSSSAAGSLEAKEFLPEGVPDGTTSAMDSIAQPLVRVAFASHHRDYRSK